MPGMTTFGKRLKAARKRRGLSVRQVAEGMGVVTQRIYSLESEDSNPTLSTIEDLAAVLGVKVKELVG